MPGENDGLLGQGHELVVDAIHQLFIAAAGEIGAANAKIE
jgi:hypothetical protein